MSQLELLVDLHRDGVRQGPGGDAETRRAIDLSGLRSASGPLRIADLGCGTGAAACVLARELDAVVTAVDLLPPFVEELERRIAGEGLAGRVEPVVAAMEDLPFVDGSFDAIWSEGAVYNVGFGSGVQSWRRLLKPGGVLAVSELTWLTGERPAEIEEHWIEQYPEVGTASAKTAVLEASGYSPIGYFVLSKHCWLENYYRPMQARFEAFLERHGRSEAAASIVEAERREIALYERYAEFVGYGYYIARKVGS
jgi:SAM-dependent methyltransferase